MLYFIQKHHRPTVCQDKMFKNGFHAHKPMYGPVMTGGVNSPIHFMNISTIQ